VAFSALAQLKRIVSGEGITSLSAAVAALVKAGTHELVDHIRGEVAPDEQALVPSSIASQSSSLIWDLRLASEWKELDAHQNQNIFGVPCPAPPVVTVLRFQLRYAQTYASCLDQPCMHLFFV
jgi:hypothetical protein